LRLIEEADASTGAPLREYVWIDDRPVALVDRTSGAPVIYYIHTGQLGSPQKITDGSGALVWDGVFDPFGNHRWGIVWAQARRDHGRQVAADTGLTGRLDADGPPSSLRWRNGRSRRPRLRSGGRPSE
jgi:uncharacterized protein RhaS with RHS repeats